MISGGNGGGGSSNNNSKNDLFTTTVRELQNEAPIELLRGLRTHLDQVRSSLPNSLSAKTAEACLAGLASDGSTLLDVLTAAYLINGGVMLKHAPPGVALDDDYDDEKDTTAAESLEGRADYDDDNNSEENKERERERESEERAMTLTELEEELRRFGIDPTLSEELLPQLPCEPVPPPR
jgi:hypothetical protein